MDRLSLAFGALADPTRRAILAQLSTGEATVNDIVARHSLSQPAISKHLKVLEDAGLVTRRRERAMRPCAIAPEGLKAAAGWIDHYRRFWEGAFDRMDDILASMAPETTGNEDEDGNTR